MAFNSATISQLAHAVRSNNLEQVRSILQATPDLENIDTGDN